MTTHDPYIDPDSGVLRNRLGITDSATLTEAERDVSTLREVTILAHGMPGSFNAQHLRAIHRALFGDVYAWAGEYRSVDISLTHPFCFARHIEPQLEDLLDRLRSESYLANLERSELLDRLTHFLAELNAIHPFRDGNGRAQRVFFELLLSNLGYHLEWEAIDKPNHDRAFADAMSGDIDLLRGLLDRALRAR